MATIGILIKHLRMREIVLEKVGVQLCGGFWNPSVLLRALKVSWLQFVVDERKENDLVIF